MSWPEVIGREPWSRLAECEETAGNECRLLDMETLLEVFKNIWRDE